jgi:hypothetical protein
VAILSAWRFWTEYLVRNFRPSHFDDEELPDDIHIIWSHDWLSLMEACYGKGAVEHVPQRGGLSCGELYYGLDHDEAIAHRWYLVKP